MKKWFIIIGIIVIFLIGGYLLLSFYAVRFIQARLQQVVGPGLTIDKIEIKPTFLAAKGVRYEDPSSKKRLLQIEETRIYPALFSVLKRTLLIREWKILNPSFLFYRSAEGVVVGPWGPKEKEDGEKGENREKGGEPFHIQIDRLRISGGSVDFEDRKVGEPPARIELRELNLEIRKIRNPLVSMRSRIKLNGKMKGKRRDGNFFVEGWIDFKNIDMDMSFKTQEIEIKTFEPYYRKRVSAEIESGYINMESKIAVEKRMINAPGQLELIDLRIEEGGGTVLWIPAKTLVSLLRDKANRVQVKFRVKGNLDDPKFSLQEAFLTRVAVSLAETLGIPIKVVGETILKGTGKGAEELVEGLKSIEKLFKKKKEKKK
jgi:hypothetical protein